MGNDMFAALPSVPLSIEIAGERIDLSPLKVGEVPAFARAVQPIAAGLSASPDWLALLAEHGEAVIAVVAQRIDVPPGITTGRDRLRESRSATRLSLASRCPISSMSALST